jgi:hypothetical protein
MGADTDTGTLRATPSSEAAPLDDAGAFLRVAGLIFDEITATRVTGHVR